MWWETVSDGGQRAAFLHWIVECLKESRILSTPIGFHEKECQREIKNSFLVGSIRGLGWVLKFGVEQRNPASIRTLVGGIFCPGAR